MSTFLIGHDRPENLEAQDRRLGYRRHVAEVRARLMELTKPPSPPDLDTRADHATGVRPPE